LDRVRSVAQSCAYVFFDDINPSSVETFLADLRSRGRSIQTSNHYLSAIKQFCHWMILDRRCSVDPIFHLRKLNVKTDRRHDRRALEPEEFTRLIDAAMKGPVIESVEGHDRAIIYIVAAWTGYRRKELASMTLRSLDLTGAVPAANVQAAYSKRRRTDTIPLHPVVIERLKAWLAAKGRVDRDFVLFPLRTATGRLRKTSKMMKRDLGRAREKWIEESQGDEERRERETSDFLSYCDEDGLFADFHANRHTFITNLGRSGVPLTVAQTLARHGDVNLTANIYTHIGVSDQVAAIADLPTPPPMDHAIEAESRPLPSTAIGG
jgi:site-specific recombinase XerD